MNKFMYLVSYFFIFSLNGQPDKAMIIKSHWKAGLFHFL